MFLTNTGNIYGCGQNDYHQVSSKNINKINVPTEITNFVPQLASNEYIIQIACGDYHTMFLTSEGNVYGCGRNDYHQVNSSNTNPITQPTKITEFDQLLNDGETITKIDCGSYHTMFLTNLGNVYGCGSNLFKQVNSSNTNPITVPTKITDFSPLLVSDETITQIVCGISHTMFLTSKGKVFYGNNMELIIL